MWRTLQYVSFFFLAVVLFGQAGCAGSIRSIKNKIRPEMEPVEQTHAIKDDDYLDVYNKYEGSLWVPNNSRSMFFEDNKARNINDIITVNILEQTVATRDASTSLSRKGGMKSNITKFLGSPLTFGMDNLWGKKTDAATAAERVDRPFKPELDSDSQNTYDGTGSTKRSDKLIATVTAKVTRVFPNGNLFIEGRREVTINNEKQIINLSGIIRPEDISANNIVVSTSIAEASISIYGSGVIAEKQKPGYGHRTFDFLWPF